MHDLNIEQLPLESLAPYANNARTHSAKQIRQIADSIEAFGFTNPVLIDADGGILAGHGRVAAAKLLGINTVPTIRLANLTDAQKRAYALADNKLALNAGWDEEILAIELQGLINLDLDFDISLTGFETAEIDLLIDGLSLDEADDADDFPDPDKLRPPVTRPGYLWLLGPHRLLCADATKANSFDALMAGDKAQTAINDVPFNVPVHGHVCGLGKVKHREFAMAAGEMSKAEYVAFLKTVFTHLVTHSVDGSIHFIFIDWRHMSELLSAGREAYSEIKNLCIWNKNNGGMGSLYRSKHELVFVFKNGTAPHINNIDLGRHGRYRTNVWDYAGVNSFGTERDDALALHPTIKPVALIADAILDCSKRGGIVLDAFVGSGTTIIAAERTGRRAYAMEIDEIYVDTAIRRWQAHTGDAAIHAETGKSFSEIEDVHNIEAHKGETENSHV